MNKAGTQKVETQRLILDTRTVEALSWMFRDMCSRWE